MDKDLMYEQIIELCKLTSKACYKISADCEVPLRSVIELYLSTMKNIFDDTDDAVNNS